MEKKGDYKTFWCQVCCIEVTSVETKRSHVEGKEHKENVERCEQQDGPSVVPMVNTEKIKDNNGKLIKNNANIRTLESISP